MQYRVLNIITDEWDYETSSLNDAMEYVYRIGGDMSLLYVNAGDGHFRQVRSLCK